MLTLSTSGYEFVPASRNSSFYSCIQASGLTKLLQSLHDVARQWFQIALLEIVNPPAK